MRNLLILVGSPGSGKSTWIKENNLQKYTISPDDIRLLLSAPQYNTNGQQVISQDNDGRVWKMLDEILEARMENGDFTIVDATHTREKYLKRYKQLADNYRYRLYVKRFDVELDELIRRNNERDLHKFVPEEAIRLHYQRLQNLVIPNSIQQIDRIKEINEFIRNEVINKPLYVIGDIHGTIEPLQQFIDEHGNEDAYYVFCGDYIDRGVNNVEVINLLMSLSQLKNYIFLEGNHERWLWMWANDEISKIRSREFLNKTAKQLEDGCVSKKEVRIFYRKLRTFFSCELGDASILVSHGGVSTRYPDFISTKQFINGVGDYESIDEVYETWKKNDPGRFVLVHGHRNIQKYPVQVSDRIFNLDGSVEHGGSLRVVRFGPNAEKDIFEYKNNNYIAPVKESKEELGMTGVSHVDELRSSPYVREVVNGDISSFNFTSRAFIKGVWNSQTIKARGLFINNKTNEIVARSYNKFFNYKELEITSDQELNKNLVFPVKVWNKYNGFLCIVGYDKESGKVLYNSKSSIDGEHAQMARSVLYELGLTEDKLLPIVSTGCSMIFEVIEPEKDPHIIKYEKRDAYLLDIVKNDFEFVKWTDEDVAKVARELGVKSKELVCEVESFNDLMFFIKTKQKDIETEGFVVEDKNGFMFKIKGDYYKKWKSLRGLKDRVFRDGFRISDYVFDDHSLSFLNWVKKTFNEESIKEIDIIKLRDMHEQVR